MGQERTDDIIHIDKKNISQYKKHLNERNEFLYEQVENNLVAGVFF